jgi:ureidoglycolate lyase
MKRIITPQPLTRETFAPFGDVIDIDGANQFEINSGFTTRVHDMIDIQLLGESARAQFSFFLGRPRPLEIRMLEQHPLGSQAFFPVDDYQWLVVTGLSPRVEHIHAFWASGRQGVNYHAGVWHHPLFVLQAQQFVVVDRGGIGNNCIESDLENEGVVTITLK